MGEIYTRFKELRHQSPQKRSMEKMRLVKFELNGKNYEIFLSRKRANKYSIIHCNNRAIEWEQLPLLSCAVGRCYGIREPIISLTPEKESVRIVVILGKPSYISGLDDGIFRSIHQYDEAYINVMSEARFKEI